MHMKGTDFQIKVWKELQNIPKGSVKTYKEVSQLIGHPNAARAVASACAKNRYPKTVPCHRVIRSDGKVGGYSLAGGVKRKKKLLLEEYTEVFLIVCSDDSVR
jgi:methylated-DNA-[protein]-cysteine S-methyltransferase